MRVRVARIGVVLCFVAGGVVGAGRSAVHADPATECAAGTDTAQLNAELANEVADIVAFDSPHVIALPDGRSVWTVQDAFISTTGGPRTATLRPPTGFAHNALLVQQGSCFTSLHGTVTPGEHCAVSDASYVGQESTATCSHWYWPLSGGVAANGQVAIFYVEMANESGGGAAAGAHPVSVWLARFDAATFDLVSFSPAPAPWAEVVYGAAVESDQSYTYLFGWSYDQFDLPDPGSPPPSQMFIARVPLGRFDVLPLYWNGASWVGDRSKAVPIDTDPGGAANAMQPRLIDGQWVSVVKPGDWNGSTVRVETAPAAQGPWTTVRTVTVPTRTLDGRTNTYAATLLPGRAPNGNLVVAISNNAWQMDPVALDAPTLYQPRLFEVQAPDTMPTTPWQATSAPLGFVPISPPVRALDTRRGAPLRTAHSVRVSLTGIVPAGAQAAVIDLAAVNPTADGFLTAWACDQPMPGTSNVNFAGGETRAAHSVVALAADGSICVYTMIDTDVVVDVTGAYSTAADALRFHPTAPTRLYDSRIAGGIWHTGETRAIAVPPDAVAVAINVTVTEPVAAGFLTVFPCQSTLPVVSNLNYTARQVVANLVQIGVTAGMICVHSMVRAHVVIDLEGTYDNAPDGLLYQSVVPTRVVDTRIGVGSVYGRVALDAGGLGVLPSNAPVALSRLPADARAVMVSLIAVTPRGPGWAEIGPCVEPAYTTPYGSSALNFVGGDVVANQAIAPTRAASGADVCSFATSPAYHVVDLTGWFV